MATFGPPPLITREDLLDVLDRNFEDHWIDRLLEDPNSLAIFEGMIAALLRIQTAVDSDLSDGGYILSAPGPARATSVVRLQRPSGAAVTIEADRRFQDDRGMIWRPVAAFAVAASGVQQTVDVPIQTDRRSNFLNSFLPLTYSILDALPDPGFVVIDGPDPASNASVAFLDQHGKERKRPRAESESDQLYRNRLRFLEEMVSPSALARTVARTLDAFPATKPIADLISIYGMAAMVEPFIDFAQPAQVGLRGLRTPFCDDVQPTPLLASAPDPGGTFCDDIAHTLRDRFDATAWFDVFIPTPVDPAEARRFYDDADPTAGSWFDDPTYGYPDLPPGDGILAPIAALADELDKRRAGCVRFRIVVGEDVTLLRHPLLFSLANAGDWLDQDGLATDGALTSALESYDGDDSYAISATGTGPGAATAAGDLRFNLPVVPAPLTVSRVVLRAQVRRADLGVGTDPSFQFLLRPSSSGAFVRIGTADVIDHEDYRQKVLILEENPVTAAAWTLTDIAGTFGFGCANVAAAGPTEQLRVSELILEIVANYG